MKPVATASNRKSHKITAIVALLAVAVAAVALSAFTDMPPSDIEAHALAFAAP
jgi:hypothetical protein